VPIRLPGSLDVKALENSINALVRRHESLRTSFSVIEGQPVQVIADQLVLELKVNDLRELPDSARDAEAHRLAALEAQKPFNLASGPLIRVELLKLTDHDHVLLLTLHHIIADGWSMDILFRELGILYNSYVSGQNPALPELKIQYADFACWQRQWLTGDVLEHQLQYWKNQLSAAPAVLDLPTDRPRPAVQMFRGGVYSFAIESEIVDKLKQLGEHHHVTLFMTMLAAFKTLLYRYTGQTDLVVGSPIANRTRPELEGLIGFFANTLVLRTDLSGDPTFVELLARIREVTLGAFTYQDMPFEKLVEELHPERSLKHNPLFQVVFTFQSIPTSQTPQTPPQHDGSSTGETAPVAVGNGTAKFDLMMTVIDYGQSAHGFLEYSTDLFDESSITLMIQRFQTLLANIALHPDSPISQLEITSQAERQFLAAGLSGPQPDSGLYIDFNQILKDFSKQAPSSIAIVDGKIELTYQQLQQRAGLIAAHLLKLGIGAEDVVGVHLPRSANQVVAMLGVLNAGAACLPLDTSEPPLRLNTILEDSIPRIIITEHSFKDH